MMFSLKEMSTFLYNKYKLRKKPKLTGPKLYKRMGAIGPRESCDFYLKLVCFFFFNFDVDSFNFFFKKKTLENKRILEGE